MSDDWKSDTVFEEIIKHLFLTPYGTFDTPSQGIDKVFDGERSADIYLLYKFWQYACSNTSYDGEILPPEKTPKPRISVGLEDIGKVCIFSNNTNCTHKAILKDVLQYGLAYVDETNCRYSNCELA